MPQKLELEYSFDKATKTIYVKSTQNPGIYALASDKETLIKNLNAVIYHNYGITEKEAKKLGDIYNIIIVDPKNFNDKKADEPQKFELSSHLPFCPAY